MEDGVHSKKRMSKSRRIMSEQVQDFASNTTLHGLGYIARRGLTTVEKIFWLITFCVSVAFCVYQISNVWTKWQESPVIVSINEELVPVSKVPFPSVTICPQWKVFKYDYKYGEEKAKQELAYLPSGLDIQRNATPIQDRRRFEDVALICEKNIIELQYLSLLNRTYSDMEVVENINQATNRHINYLLGDSTCSWQNEIDSRCNMLKKVYTQEGICYNFNGMAAEDIFRQEEIQQNYPYIEKREQVKGWSAENGYDGTNHPYPKRGRQNGADPDFVLVFEENRLMLDKECNPLHSGYKVYVHHPTDMPQSFLYYYALVPDQTSSFALKYSVVSTSSKLKEYSAEIRRCYFADERYLRYFQIYTENNCRMECLSNYTYSMCGCVGYYMPHNTTDRICTIQSTICMEEALEELAEKESPDIILDPKHCNCLPLCNNIEYDADILKTEFKMKQNYIDMNGINLNNVEVLGNYSFSRLEMFFKSPRFVSMRRSELFGTTDFIANCGGLLGLFLGFSFLSLVEIIYFITLRFWCTFHRNLNEENENEITSPTSAKH